MKSKYEKLVDCLDKRGYLNQDLVDEIEQIYGEEQLSINGVVVSYVAEDKVKEIDNYLSDLDNLIDTGHFPNDSVRDYTFWHKEMGLKQFIIKGRELIRQLIMKEKGLIG